MFSKFFINRPIFATVLALLIVVAGLVTLNILPVAQFPEITPPTVQVSAVYPGANAETVAQTEWCRRHALYVFQFFIFGSIFSDYYIRCWYGHRYGNCAGTKQGKYRTIIAAGTGGGARGHCAETIFKHCDVFDNDFAGLCVQQPVSD